MDAKQIIGIEFANEKYGDCTVLNSMCTKCKTIIESKEFKVENNSPQMSLFIKCPVCGVKFKSHKLYEEVTE